MKYFTTAFTNVILIDSPTYHRHFSARPPRYHQITSDFLCESQTDWPTDHLRKIVTTDQSVLSFPLYINNFKPDFLNFGFFLSSYNPFIPISWELPAKLQICSKPPGARAPPPEKTFPANGGHIWRLVSVHILYYTSVLQFKW